MKRWVVTGPAGSGKSALCAMLASRGAVILSGDALGHEILGDDTVAAAVGSAFGPAVMKDGRVDRRSLGDIVFGDRSELEKLNSLTHGPLASLIASRFDHYEQQGLYRLAVLEAAVYFLLPPVPRVELVVTVTSGQALRLKRLVDSGLDPARARARIAAQGHLAAGYAQADLVLVNDGSLADLEKSAGALWERLDD